MISSICRRRTSRETVAATDGSIFSITRSRSEAGIIGWWIAGSSRLGVDTTGTLGACDGALGADPPTLGVARGKLVADAGKPVANEGRAGASSSRLPNFFIAAVL